MSSVRSREETKFLALLTKTQERASNLGGHRKKNVRQNKPEVRQSIIENESRDPADDEEESGEEEVDWRLPKVKKKLYFIILLSNNKVVEMRVKISPPNQKYLSSVLNQTGVWFRENLKFKFRWGLKYCKVMVHIYKHIKV